MAHIAWQENPPPRPDGYPSYTGLVGNKPLFSVYFKPSIGSWIATSDSALIDMYVNPKDVVAGKAACESALTRFVHAIGAEFTEPRVISWVTVKGGFDGYLGAHHAFEIRRETAGYQHFILRAAGDGYRPLLNSSLTDVKVKSYAQRLVEEKRKSKWRKSK